MNYDQTNDNLIQTIGAWNTFGLPVLLLVLVMTVLRRGTTAVQREGAAAIAVKRLAGVHLAMAFWALTTVVAELWVYRTMGVFPSNPVSGFFGSSLVLAINLLLGIGLQCRWKLARWGAFLWSLFRFGIALLLLYNPVMPYAPRIDWTEWPHDFLYWTFPPFELIFLLIPEVASVFRPALVSTLPTESQARRPWLDVFSVVYLAVALSAAITDAIDWSIRTAAESILLG